MILTDNNTPRVKKMKIILQCENGSFPYLTPFLVNKYFPSKEYKDHLVLGMAVRDTCVVPMFRDSNAKKSKKKKAFVVKENRPVKRLRPDESESNPDQNADDSSNRCKPIGYTFDVPKTLLDCLEKVANGYDYLLVPTFDLLDDRKNGALSHTNSHIQLSTYNGMTKITPELYHKISHNLQLGSVLSLYDQPSTKKKKKREQELQQLPICMQRTLSWLDQHLSDNNNNGNSQSKQELWSPLLLPDNEYIFEKDTNEMIQKVLEKSKRAKEQVLTLVGWHHGNNQESILKNVQAQIELSPSSGTILAVLNSIDLFQFLLAAKSGVSYIGTSIPTQMAKSKKALCIQPFLSEETNTTNTHDLILDLKETIYEKDSNPLIHGCTCISCCNEYAYSRSYIHHLIKAKELLGEILLFAHNLHQILLLVKQLSYLRESSDTTKIQNLCSRIESKLSLK